MSDRARRAREIYLAICELQAVDHGRLLDLLCGEDRELRGEVEGLLERGGERKSLPPQFDSTLGIPDPPMKTGEIGGLIGEQYLIRGKLGSGGMGVVYHGLDVVLEREVAIKVLPRKFARDSSWQERFQHEARMLARLNHPHIALIYALVRFEEEHYLILEYVPGKNLRKLLDKGPIPLGDSLRIALELADALAAAHKRGVVHRDLKPENIQKTPEGVAKILDFGLAIQVRKTGAAIGAPGPSSSSLGARIGLGSGFASSSDEVAGTPGYMSPEQINGSKVDSRTDVFSFGCVLYECLSGEMAFGGGSARERLDRTLIEDPDWSRLPPDLPSPLCSLLVSCLEKGIPQRLPDMDQVKRALGSVLSREDGVPPSRPRPAARHNLPAQVTSFIARTGEIERLHSLLKTNRLVTLAGPGGCGKTRLALELARGLVGVFADGVWLLEIAPLETPEAVMRSAARMLEVREDPSVSLLEAIGRRIQGQSILLILDNCEHQVPCAAALCDHLLRRCEGLTVLTTSQEPLGITGEMVYRVGSLSVPGEFEADHCSELLEFESVRLFLDRARLTRPDFELLPANASAVREICTRLDGIPLAIELAAARVAMMGVDEIARKLDRRFRLLVGGNSLSLPRHKTLEATVDWSCRLLSGRDQAALRRLSIFPASFTLEAAGAVLAQYGDDFEVLGCVTRLVEKSLAIADDASGGETRYRLLESIRSFAREKLIEEGELASAGRLMAAYLVGRVRRGDGEGWSFREERDNLRAALAWCEGEERELLESAIERAHEDEGRRGDRRPREGR